MFYESRLLVDSDSRSLRFVHFNILKNSCLSSRFPVPSCPRPESGCKGKACFSFSKFFKLFFQTFFREPFQTLLTTTSFKPFLVLALSLESGCKDKAIKSFLPNFYPVIFYFFTTYCSTVNCKLSFSRLTLHRRLKRKRSVFLPRKSSIGYNTCNKQTDQRIYRKNEPFYSNFFTFVIYENSKIS